MNLKIGVLLIVLVLCFTGCKSKKGATGYKKVPKTERIKKPVKIAGTKNTAPVKVEESPTVVVVPKTNASYDEVVAAYISNYGAIAKAEMKQYGIPASITIAQGILESGAGRGELTRKAKNHFGIKCHKGWTGGRVYHDDDEMQECFRKYDDPKTSYRDHSLFLSGRSRYADLFKLKIDDYKGWAKGLRKAGYATDPKYPDKLISIIERYNLSLLDDAVLHNRGEQAIPVASQTTNEVHSVSSYTVTKGDTLYSISRRYGLSVDTLKRLNGLTSNEISIGQRLNVTSQN